MPAASPLTTVTPLDTRALTSFRVRLIESEEAARDPTTETRRPDLMRLSSPATYIVSGANSLSTSFRGPNRSCGANFRILKELSWYIAPCKFIRSVVLAASGEIGFRPMQSTTALARTGDHDAVPSDAPVRGESSRWVARPRCDPVLAFADYTRIRPVHQIVFAGPHALLL